MTVTTSRKIQLWNAPTQTIGKTVHGYEVKLLLPPPVKTENELKLTFISVSKSAFVARFFDFIIIKITKQSAKRIKQKPLCCAVLQIESFSYRNYDDDYGDEEIKFVNVRHETLKIFILSEIK